MILYFCSQPCLWKSCPEWAGRINPEIIEEAFSECRHLLFAFEEFLDDRIETKRIPEEEWDFVTAEKETEDGIAVGLNISPDEKIVTERICVEMNRQLEKLVGIMRRTLDGAVREGILIKPGN